MRRQAAEVGADPYKLERKIAELRSKALEQAKTDAAEMLEEIRQRKAVMVQGIVDIWPGGGAKERELGAVDRIVDGERMRRPKAEQPDPARFAHRPVKELGRLAAASEDVVELADLRDALLLRAEQRGNADAETEATFISAKLLRAAAALPSVQERARRYASIAQVEEYITIALNAIATGGEDAGLRYESYANASAARAAGDHRPATLVERRDGSTVLELAGADPDAA